MRHVRQQDEGGTVADSARNETDDEQQNPIQRLIKWRVSAAMEPHDPSQTVLKLQQPLVDLLNKYYFRLEVDGWDRVPDENCLVIGVHSGGALTMDAWTLVGAWHDHFQGKRHLHGTAHDVLMAAPGVGDYFRKMGVLPAAPDSISAALAEGRDVALWPGGEVDSLRPWAERDRAVLAGRKGFVRMAIASGVPIVPVATVGGPDSMPVLFRGRRIASALQLDKVARLKMFPITLSAPWGIAPAALPEIPLPTKIRTAFQEPIGVDNDPSRVDDADYVERKYDEVIASLQHGMDALARRRKFPVFG
jgi:1-acyl-sn-glycerol-3-phosphate acyltransferase